MSDLIERLRKPMNRDEFFKVADGLCREAADEIDRLTRELAEARRERDAAFAMSKCECGADEACRNIVQARDKALDEAAGVVASLSFPESTGAPLEDALIRIGEIVAANAAAAIRALKEKP